MYVLSYWHTFKLSSLLENVKLSLISYPWPYNTTILEEFYRYPDMKVIVKIYNSWWIMILQQSLLLPYNSKNAYVHFSFFCCLKYSGMYV